MMLTNDGLNNESLNFLNCATSDSWKYLVMHAWQYFFLHFCVFTNIKTFIGSVTTDMQI